VQLQDFGDLLAHVPDRVERRLRLLEDHADPIAADVAHLLVGHGQQVLTVEHDPATLDAPGLRDQPHDRKTRHGLAAARLADEPHDLAAIDVEIDAVDGMDDALARVERCPQPLDLEQWALAPLVLWSST
jgi:hypothetical protein